MSPHAWKVKLFWWQIGHNVVLVGEWLGKRDGPLGCPLCSSSTTSWSVAAWIDHSIDRWTDVVNADSLCYVCTRGKIVKIRFERGLHPASLRFPEIWMLIAGFTLWYIWKVRCLKVFKDMVCPRRKWSWTYGSRLSTAYEGNWMRFAATPMTWSLPVCAFRRNGRTHLWWRKEEVELPVPTLAVSYSPSSL